MKVTITLIDNPDGSVGMECYPPLTHLVAKSAGGHPISKAESVAIIGLARMVESSKDADRKGDRFDKPRSPLVIA